MPLKIQLGAEITSLASADVGGTGSYEEASTNNANNTLDLRLPSGSEDTDEAGEFSNDKT